MARGRELPDSFEQALKSAERILSANHELVTRNVVSSEAEQLVIGAYRKVTGTLLARLDLFTRIRDRFPENAAEMLLTLAALRAEGRPLQHLIGYQAFLSHDYEVGPEVLVPRPETEVLVSIALEKLKDRSPKIGLEIGLGSGAISIELLSALPGLRMVATEVSAGARAIATRNADKILGTGKARLRIVHVSDTKHVLQPLQAAGPFKADFLISNPPYLASESEVDQEVARHEPHLALFAPQGDPLFFYREIAQGSKEMLVPGGQVFVEIPHERASEIAALFPNTTWNAKLFTDLNGRERVLVAALI